jgi:hypothetical protein
MDNQPPNLRCVTSPRCINCTHCYNELDAGNGLEYAVIIYYPYHCRLYHGAELTESDVVSLVCDSHEWRKSE